MARGIPPPLAIKDVRRLEGIFFARVPEIRKSVAQHRDANAFLETLAWLGVCLQVLVGVGWRPKCSQSQIVDSRRSVPPPERQLP